MKKCKKYFGKKIKGQLIFCRKIHFGKKQWWCVVCHCVWKSQRERSKYIYTKYVLGYQNHKTDDQRASSKFWKKKK